MVYIMPTKPWIPTEKELLKIEELAAQGMTQEKIAWCLGIDPCTLSKKKKNIDKLDLAIKRGMAKGLDKVTKALLNNIDLGNPACIIFYLKAKDKWRDHDPKDQVVNNESLIEKLIDKL